MPGVLLDATPQADLSHVPARRVLAIDGAGPPSGAPFQAAVGALYGVAYTVKFTRKRAGGEDFKIGPLEGRWAADANEAGPLPPPPERWLWRLRLGVPPDVSEAEVLEAIHTATHKKGGKLEGSSEPTRVFLEHVPAQQVGRALHVGPFASERQAFEAIDAVVTAAGLVPALTHVEVYLSDPRRTEPARLRTVLLRELQ